MYIDICCALAHEVTVSYGMQNFPDIVTEDTLIDFVSDMTKVYIFAYLEFEKMFSVDC